MKIENAVALVTGANRGIGLAFTRELLARGGRRVAGALLNVLSVASWVDGGGLAAYSASRYADGRW